MKRLLDNYPLTPEQTVNVLTEFGPLIALFVFTFLFDFEIGTWALVLSTAVALVVSLKFISRVPIMPFLGGGVSIAFGAASLITHNPMWVQIKVTIFNALFAGLLMLSLSRGKSLLQHIFGKTFRITPEGWRKVTVAWAVFFVFTAVINEIVRQIGTPQVWAAFKVFFIMPVAGLFGVWQSRLIQNYRMGPEAASVVGEVAPAGIEACGCGPELGAAGPAPRPSGSLRPQKTPLPAEHQ